MASKQDLAKIFAEELMNNEFSRNTVESIISRIKNLQYAGSENIISVADKVEIAINIKEYFRLIGIQKGIKTSSSGDKLFEQRSNDEFLLLVDYILDQVKK